MAWGACHGSSPTGWGNPFVLGAIALGIVLLALFVWIELHASDPMFWLELFRIRMFTAGNIAGFLSALARGGLQFMLIIWLQGIWLPLHGYSFQQTPLWAGVYMVPLLAGFVLMGPVSGYLSDRFGARIFSTCGMALQVAGFLALTTLPADFLYPIFAVLIFVLGCGSGLFASPNTSAIMSSVPPDQRGVSSGMRATFQNSASVVSIGLFFSIVTAGLAATLPATFFNGLTQNGVPAPVATGIAHLPPTAALFGAFLGYNPVAQLLPPSVLAGLSPAQRDALLGKVFFPHLISGPFMSALHLVFIFSACLCAVAGIASFLRGSQTLAAVAQRGSSVPAPTATAIPAPSPAPEAPAEAQAREAAQSGALDTLVD